MAQARKSKELDHYLKSVISGVPKKTRPFLDSGEKKLTYYTGNWATDVLNNFTEKQSEKIFKNMSKYMSNPNVQFFQKKNKNIEIGTWSEYGENEPESISSYDYIIIKKKTSMIKTIKTVFYTLSVVFIFAFAYVIWHTYEQSKVNAKELEIEQEIVETLEEITNVTKPDFERENNQTFINSVGQCVEYIYNTTTDVIPVNFRIIIIEKAALESGWGNSRFALEGKNLFGIRTYDLRGAHMLPSNNPKKWGVRVYMHECDSVQHYIDILNNGSAFKEYRVLKHDQDVNDPFKLLLTLDAYASDKDYFPKIKRIIKKLREDYEIPIIK